MIGGRRHSVVCGEEKEEECLSPGSPRSPRSEKQNSKFRAFKFPKLNLWFFLAILAILARGFRLFFFAATTP